jgi:Cdc6-like AAA superfamily ATPase
MNPSHAEQSVDLLEREREIERVRDVLRAASRRHGMSLIVEGAAGVGKSSVLGEARRTIGSKWRSEIGWPISQSPLVTP